MKANGKTTGGVLIESSVAGVQTIKDRDTGFKRGLAASCPGIKVAAQRFNNNELNAAASQVNDVLTANSNIVGIFADNNTSGVGTARAIKDNNAKDKIPVVAFDTDPQENAALADGSIDALVVQNPYFFGYQGVVEAGMAAVGSQPPPKLDPGAVVATTKNAQRPDGQAAAEPADGEGLLSGHADRNPRTDPARRARSPSSSRSRARRRPTGRTRR